MSPEHLALLMKTEWQLSYVTPLYQFRHTQLKNYSRQLAAFIAAERQQGLAVEVEGPHSSFKVCFSVLQGMVVTDDDAETVLIQVIVIPQCQVNASHSDSVCRAIMTCIVVDVFSFHSMLSNLSVNYPISVIINDKKNSKS